MQRPAELCVTCLRKNRPECPPHRSMEMLIEGETGCPDHLPAASSSIAEFYHQILYVPMDLLDDIIRNMPAHNKEKLRAYRFWEFRNRLLERLKEGK